jgi:hypothetical protein
MTTCDSTILETLGFQNVGQFLLGEGALGFILRHFSTENGNYVFVIDKRAQYIGETSNGIRHRMRQYRKPGPRQKTNQYVKKMILNELGNNRAVEIWFLDENKIREIEIVAIRNDSFLETKADNKLLERFLIKKLNPEWNRT